MCIHHLSCNLTIPYCIVLHSAMPCLDLAPEAEGKGWITVPIRADSSSFLLIVTSTATLSLFLSASSLSIGPSSPSPPSCSPRLSLGFSYSPISGTSFYSLFTLALSLPSLRRTIAGCPISFLLTVPARRMHSPPIGD